MLKRIAGIIHYALFWNGSNGMQCAYFVNNGLQRFFMNRSFLNIIHKMVISGSQQKGTLKLVNPKHEGWASTRLVKHRRRRASWNKIKSRQNGNRQGNNNIRFIFWSHSRSDWEVIVHSVFILKCVSIRNITIEHYMEGVIR